MWVLFVIAAKLTDTRFSKDKPLMAVAAKGCLTKAALELEQGTG